MSGVAWSLVFSGKAGAFFIPWFKESFKLQLYPYKYLNSGFRCYSRCSHLPTLCLCVQEKAKELEDKVHLLQTGTMELQRAQDLQALQMASGQTELAAVTENSIKLQKEKEVKI